VDVDRHSAQLKLLCFKIPCCLVLTLYWVLLVTPACLQVAPPFAFHIFLTDGAMCHLASRLSPVKLVDYKK